jgi:hypothetical protein
MHAFLVHDVKQGFRSKYFAIREHEIAILDAAGYGTPYAGGWWLTGKNINRVVGELAGLCTSDIRPLQVMGR